MKYNNTLFLLLVTMCPTMQLCNNRITVNVKHNNLAAINAQLWQAVCYADTYNVERLLRSGVSPLIRNEAGETLLHIAARKNNGILQILLRYGANPCMLDEKGRPPLWDAIESMQYTNVQALLCHGASLQIRVNGVSSVHFAIQKKAYAITQLLLQSGASAVVCNDYGDTPLHCLVEKGWDDVCVWIDLLLSYGALLEAKNHYGKTPLQKAVATSYTENREAVVSLLIQRGANVFVLDTDGTTVLHNAIAHNNVCLVPLLSSWISLSAVNCHGETPLHYAANYTVVKAVELLLSSGVDVNVCDNEGNTPLYNACHKDAQLIAVLLVNHGAYVNMVNKKGETPLLAACRCYSSDLPMYLVKHGADVTVVDPKDSQTLLHKAARRNWEDFTLLLLQHHLAIDAFDKYGKTPLSYAVSNKNVRLVSVLLSYGASTLYADNTGDTVLHSAVANNDLTTARMLLQAGSQVDRQNKKGETPLHIAYDKRSLEMLKLLARYGACIDIPDNQGKIVIDQISACLRDWSFISSIKSFFGMQAKYSDVQEIELFLLRHGSRL